MTTTNAVCLAGLATAKVAGLVGVCCAYAGQRMLGVVFLALAGVLLLTVVGLCVRAMRESVRRDEADVELLRRMALDGSFAEKAREAGLHVTLRKTA